VSDHATADADGAPADGDELTPLRDELATVDERPVAERVAVFERVNDGLAAELARLDEV
jgi:hypothetical protein